ncbi:MAG: thiol reductase thioredoxin [Bacteroidales bacterium]|nr:thiol reductase thioredoxin [Bacteroidales bacterium]
MNRKALLAILMTASVVLAGCSDTNASEKKNNSEKGVSGTDGGLTAAESSDKSGDPSDAKGTINLNRSDFIKKVFNYEANSEEWKYEGDLPAIVDFYADWCQPCRIASPILDELAKEYEGKIYVYKIDTEKERELSSVFGIQSLPTFMLIPMDGNPQVFSGIGQTPEATKEIFKKAIDEVLLKTKTESK